MTLWRVSDLRVYVLPSQPKGGLESLLCKETFVVVACGRVVQDRSDFSFSVKTCLSTQAVHLFITRRSTSTELYWSCKLFIPSQRISQAVSNHSLCLDCAHLEWLLCSKTGLGQRLQQDVRTGPPDILQNTQKGSSEIQERMLIRNS